MNKGKLREVLKDIQRLTEQECHNEARLKLAVALNRYNEAKIIIALDYIQDLEKHLPRALLMYRTLITERLLRHVRETLGPEVADKILKALKTNHKGTDNV